MPASFETLTYTGCAAPACQSQRYRRSVVGEEPSVFFFVVKVGVLLDGVNQHVEVEVAVVVVVEEGGLHGVARVGHAVFGGHFLKFRHTLRVRFPWLTNSRLARCGSVLKVVADR